MEYTISQLDNMDGHEFEYAVADLLFHNGWRDVEVTQGSGDYGVDILARRKNARYGIQCKRYQGNVGVKAIQEAMAGAEFYNCDIAAVITNSAYTKQAANLAKISGVRLFERGFLEELIGNYDNEYDSLDPENALALIREIKSTEKIKNDKNFDQKESLEKKSTMKKNQVAKQTDKKKTSVGCGCLVTVALCSFLVYGLFQIIHMIGQIF